MRWAKTADAIAETAARCNITSLSDRPIDCADLRVAFDSLKPDENILSAVGTDNPIG